MLKLLSSFVLFAAFILPQEVDSLLKQDIPTIPDTNFVQIGDTTAVSDSNVVFLNDSVLSGITVVTSHQTKKDSIIPIQGQTLSDVSTIINKRTFLFDQYRYTGDLLRSFSVNFVKDLGFIGYPNEIFIYGVGSSGISYLQDGVFWNNRYANSLDLNLIQSENIDSIEIVPSPRGFLYGPYNNPVTVNFITRDFISPQPDARIRYYEGPDGEAMIDGKFSTMVAKRWNYSFQLTNRSKDETYVNTELSLWQFNTKLKYLLSNSVNLQAYYYYVDKQQGLNGGVDYDSLSRSSDDPNADLYDPIAAPVRFPNQKLDVLQHNVGLRTLAKPFDNSQLDLSIYFRYGLDKLRDIRDSIDYKSDNKSKSYGTALNYYYTYDFLTLQFFGNYEKSDFDYMSSYHTTSYKDEFYNLGGLATLSTSDNTFKFSFFYKQGYREITDYKHNIFGLDIKYILLKNISLYAGYSLRNTYWISEEVPSFESGIQYNTSNYLLDLKYFYNEYFNREFWMGGPEIILDPSPEKIKGFGLNLNYKLWLILLETNTSYYFKVDDERPINLPDWQFAGGLYVNDFFFDNNLDLKAGFKFYYTGEINSSVRWWWGSTVVEPTNKLDFNLAGEIQKVAIFYFQWENLFGNEYYITPYYPMPVRNIKFGIAWELFN